MKPESEPATQLPLEFTDFGAEMPDYIPSGMHSAVLAAMREYGVDTPAAAFRLLQLEEAEDPPYADITGYGA